MKWLPLLFMLSACAAEQQPVAVARAVVEISGACPNSVMVDPLPKFVTVVALRSAYDKLLAAHKETIRARDVCAERLRIAARLLRAQEQ